MSTAVTEQPKQSEGRVIEYVPLGSKNNVQLTMGMVKKFLCTPTKRGNIASDSDIVKFMMLCKARELDPWVGDAYLVGYDSNDGPVFSLITAAQALLKRAEISPEYNGMQSGVILTNAEGVVEYREGDLVLDKETLVGGWAKVFRKDHEHPSYDSLKLSTFNTERSRWAKDPAGMIVKCAESSALRKAFPTQLGGLFSREEMEHLSETRIENRVAGNAAPIRTASNLDELAGHIEQQVSQPQTSQRLENQTDAPRSLSDESESNEVQDNDEQRDPLAEITAEFDAAKNKAGADALKMVYIGAAYPPAIREHAEVCYDVTMKRLERESKKAKGSDPQKDMLHK